MTPTKRMVLRIFLGLMVVLLILAYWGLVKASNAFFAMIQSPPRKTVETMKSKGVRLTPQDWGMAGERLLLEKEGVPKQVAWWMPQEDPAAPVILFLHGLAVRSEYMFEPAARQHQRGYACLSVDLRGHGESEGLATFGWQERHDLADWVGVLKSRGVEPNGFGFYGGSYGAAVALQAATLAKEVRFVVALQPFTDFDRAMSDYMELGFGRRHLPLIDGWLRWRFYRRLGISNPTDLSALSLFENLETLPPILVVHGDRDRNLQISHSRDLAGKFPNRVRLIEIPGAEHDGIYQAMGAAVHGEIDRFISDHLPG